MTADSIVPIADTCSPALPTTTLTGATGRCRARPQRARRRPQATWLGWRAWWRADGGSVAAEVTIVVPFLIMLLVFVAVVIHRGVDARIRVDDAAHQAARAASIERTTASATTAARTTAQTALAQAGVACATLSTTTTSSVAAGGQPGGAVSVTVSCQVDFGAALVLGVPTSKTVSATAIEPLDRYRSTAYATTVATTSRPV